MRGGQARPALASYRDAVTELIRAGEPFAEIEQAIAELTDLTTDERDVLWLYAFTLREHREDRPRLALVR